jgi:murein endopeptidase
MFCNVRSSFPWALVLALGLVVATADDVVAGTPEKPLSLGYPNAGRLVDGKRFRETPFLVMVPAHEHSSVRWALPALLSVLDRASRIVARKFPGSVLELGELSRREGGPISSHRSHQNGRDADVGFYLSDLDGQPVRAPSFLRCESNGVTRDDPTLHFDDARNWAFVRAALEDPHNEVRQIFIYAPLRARLLAFAAKVHAPREVRLKAAKAMMQPINALPHDDHFHLRISCPSDQVEDGCADLPLWRTPGSPDEFGSELVAEAESVRPSVGEGSSLTALNAFPPEDWGSTSRLWSIERGLCDPGTLSCSELDDGPACQSLGDLGVPPFPEAAEDTAKPETLGSSAPALAFSEPTNADEEKPLTVLSGNGSKPALDGKSLQSIWRACRANGRDGCTLVLSSPPDRDSTTPATILANESILVDWLTL